MSIQDIDRIRALLKIEHLTDKQFTEIDTLMKVIESRFKNGKKYAMLLEQVTAKELEREFSP